MARASKLPTHVCLVCKQAQWPCTKRKHGHGKEGAPQAWCWICEAIEHPAKGPYHPVRRLTDAEIVAYRIGGQAALEPIVRAAQEANE